jgi:hypothetical protein
VVREVERLDQGDELRAQLGYGQCQRACEPLAGTLPEKASIKNSDAVLDKLVKCKRASNLLQVSTKLSVIDLTDLLEEDHKRQVNDVSLCHCHLCLLKQFVVFHLLRFLGGVVFGDCLHDKASSSDLESKVEYFEVLQMVIALDLVLELQNVGNVGDVRIRELKSLALKCTFNQFEQKLARLLPHDRVVALVGRDRRLVLKLVRKARK